MNAQALDPSIDNLIHRELPAAARGDRAAYGRIVAASQNTVTAVALAITRDVATSEDVAQEAFLSAWQHLGRLQNPASFLPWLRQITRNLARDDLRARRHRPLDGDGVELAIANAADPSPSPVQRLIADEREAAAADLISALPEESREVLLLYYREGQSSRQVATLLGLSDAAVRKRLSRARQCVREDLLRRFGDFARGSAPGAVFTATIASVLMTASPPVAASVALNIGTSAVGKAAAKLGLGTLGGLAVGFGASIVAMYYATKYLLHFAATEQERADIRRFAVYQGATTLFFVASLLLLVRYSTGWVPLLAVTIAGFAAINYQALVWLPKIMAPCFAREAARDPVKAARDRRAFTWIYGWIGAVIGTLAALSALFYSLVASGRL
jgi:RNA polymerase sigma factor (sigma-70 family)